MVPILPRTSPSLPFRSKGVFSCPRTAVVLLVLASALGALPASEGMSMSRDMLLRLLRAKDAQLDNVRLDYTVSGIYQTKPFPAWKFPQLARKHGWDREKPEKIPFRYKESLVRRGPHVTVTREQDPTFRPPENTQTRMIPFQKWTNKNGLSREITKTGGTGRGHGILEIRPAGLPVDLVQEHGMAIEFAHGLGFGKRIKTIDKLTRVDDGWRVEGTIQIWWEDESRFSLVLDEDLIARRAVIKSNVKGNLTRFEVTTSGRAAVEGFLFAGKGSFKRISLGRLRDGKVRGKPRVLKEFATSFVSVEPHLTDKEYERLTDMTPEPGMQVDDRVVGMTFFVGEEPPDVESAIRETMAGIAEAGAAGTELGSEGEAPRRLPARAPEIGSQSPGKHRQAGANVSSGRRTFWAVVAGFAAFVVLVSLVVVQAIAKRRKQRAA